MVCQQDQLRQPRHRDVVAQCAKRIRSGFQAAKAGVQPDSNPKEPAYVESLPAVVSGRSGQRVLAVFRASPCPRGCAMCGFKSQAMEGVGYDDLLSQLDVALGSARGRDFVRLSLCTSSSTFNPRIPWAFWEEAMRVISTKPNILEVDIEARAEEVPHHLDKISRLQHLLGRRLMVGLGLETVDGFIRNDVNGKNLSLDDFSLAVRSLAEAGLGVYAYIILKLPGLLESEAVDDCVKTAEYFFGLAKRSGAPYSRVNVKPFFVPKDTIAEKLYEAGLANPPTLWSLVDALKRISRLGLAFSPLTDEGLSGGRFARNCPKCTPGVIEAVHEFNQLNRIEALDSIEPCGCKE